MYFKHKLLPAGRSNNQMQSTRFYSLIPTTDDTPFQLVRRYLPLTEHETPSPGSQKPTNGPYCDPSQSSPGSLTLLLYDTFSTFSSCHFVIFPSVFPLKFHDQNSVCIMFTPTPVSRPAPRILLVLLTTRYSPYP